MLRCLAFGPSRLSWSWLTCAAVDRSSAAGAVASTQVRGPDSRLVEGDRFMRHLLAVFAVGCLLAVGGCKDMNNNNDQDMRDSNMKSSSTSSSSMSSGSNASNDPKMMSAKDDCPHCQGVQTANADGRCPQCGM